MKIKWLGLDSTRVRPHSMGDKVEVEPNGVVEVEEKQGKFYLSQGFGLVTEEVKQEKVVKAIPEKKELVKPKVKPVKKAKKAKK